MEAREFFATVPLGIESLLARELCDLGLSAVREARAGVAFAGDLGDAYRACLWSRLANRVLLPIAHFPAPNEPALYRGVRAIDCDEHLEPESSLAVDFASSRSAMTHTLYGAQKVKDAIVDHFRDRHGLRPSVDLLRPDLRVNVYLHLDQATVSIDLSGDSLHKRGYRVDGGKAPLKENLAAAILLRAGWPAIAAEGGQFMDPMCGSGTLPIEAALMAADIAPGLRRSWFGFLGWRGHEADCWRDLIAEAERRADSGFHNLPVITGYDADRGAVHHALDNLERAGLRGHVHVERKSIDAARPRQAHGLLLVNPPYGERLGDEASLVPLYLQLGEILREHFLGWRASLFTGNPELAFKVGVRATKQYVLYNGALPCKLYNFEVDEGRFFIPHGGEPPTEADRRRRMLFRKARQVDISSAGAEMFANRLRKNLRHLGRWARQEGITCYRLYDADLPEYAVAVDLYQGERLWVAVQEYEAPSTIDPVKAEGRLIDALAVIPEVLGIPSEQLFLKVRRRQKGSGQYEKQSETGRFHVVEEGGLRLQVNFEDYLDTGLFLDHRSTRGMIRARSKGKSFLNLFAYTGAATLYAAMGGASSTTTVDMSKTYLDWAARNLALNGLNGPTHKLIQADCLEWLSEAVKSPWRYDLIFLDPPTFSTSKRMKSTLDIQRDHVGLLRQCLSLLTPEGELIFSTNHRKFRLESESLKDYRVTDISRRTLPRDFERNPRIHQAWLIRRQGTLPTARGD